MNNKNQNGRSMVEMLGVLAIIGVLSVGGIAGYSKAMLQLRINKTINQITSIVTKTRTLYATQSGKEKYLGLCEYDEEYEEYYCWGLDNQRRQGLLDDVENGKLASGSIELFACNAERSENPVFNYQTICENFELWLSRLTREECIKLATYNWGNINSSGLIAIGVIKGELGFVIPSDFGSEFGDVVPGCSGGTIASSNYYQALACSNGSSVSLPMPLNIAASACNCPENNCNIALIYE